MSPLVTVSLVIAVIAYVVFVAWALCRAAAMGDRVVIVPDDQAKGRAR